MQILTKIKAAVLISTKGRISIVKALLHHYYTSGVPLIFILTLALPPGFTRRVFM